MKKISFLNSPPLFVEIGQSSLKAVRENDGVELPLERQPDGRLTPACKVNLVTALKIFLKKKSWQPRARAFCAIGARGVSLRRLTLPGGTNEEFYQRLLLQIEGEFPVPPEELAWGWQPLGEQPASNGVMAKQDLLVAAVKKEIVADYHEIFRACGADPVFTLAALGRRNLCVADSFMMLDVGNSQSELTVFEKGVATNSRIVFWDGGTISGSAEAKLDGLAQMIKVGSTGTKLFISGNKISEDFPARLAKVLNNGWSCERLETAEGPGRSAAIAGLQKINEIGGVPPLLIRVEQASSTATSWAALDWKKWGMRVGALLAALLLLPYGEAVLLKPHLTKKVAAFKAEAARLKVIDRELDFLRYLKQSQPPYLDALYIFSKSVPPGTHFDALSLNSHGEVSLRCAFRDGQQVAEFRTKLIDSGFFANVTVEEQTPTPDHQRVNVRIAAQEKPLAQLQVLAASLPADEIAKEAKPSAAGATVLGGSSTTSNAPPASRKETK